MTQIPILEALLHPPLGLLVRSLIPGTWSGSFDLDRPGPTPPFNNVNAYGLTWDFFTVPAGYGRDLWLPNVFDRPMLRGSTIHTGLDSHDLVSEWHDFYSEGTYWLWANPGPTRIHLDVSPGVELTLFWLLV